MSDYIGRCFCKKMSSDKKVKVSMHISQAVEYKSGGCSTHAHACCVSVPVIIILTVTPFADYPGSGSSLCSIDQITAFDSVLHCVICNLHFLHHSEAKIL